MPDDLLLDVVGLSVAYGAARVVDRIDLQVRAGEVVALVGPNGAGKSSTLRAISGVAPHRVESIRLEGAALPRRAEVVAARGVGHVPEGRGLIAPLTVRQNIELGAAALGRALRPTTWDSILDLFPALREHLDRKAGALSGGQQQMAAIARGLAAQVKVLMVDELSLGLAPAVVSDLLRTLRQVADEQRIGLLLVDQNVRALATISDAALTIRDRTSVGVDLTQLDVMHSDYLGRTTT